MPKKAYTVFVPHGVIAEFPNKKQALDFARENRGIIMSSISSLGKVI